MTETWKDIPDFEGMYQVSNKGRVRSLDRTITRIDGKVKRWRGKLLKQSLNVPYLQVSLSKPGYAKKVKVHRLVAEAFLPNPLKLPEVDHRFGNQTDNRASQLRWASRALNAKNVHKTTATSGIVGVKHKPHLNVSPWHAHGTTPCGKQIHLGCFSTAEAATEARRKHQEQYA